MQSDLFHKFNKFDEILRTAVSFVNQFYGLQMAKKEKQQIDQQKVKVLVNLAGLLEANYISSSHGIFQRHMIISRERIYFLIGGFRTLFWLFRPQTISR